MPTQSQEPKFSIEVEGISLKKITQWYQPTSKAWWLAAKHHNFALPTSKRGALAKRHRAPTAWQEEFRANVSLERWLNGTDEDRQLLAKLSGGYRGLVKRTGAPILFHDHLYYGNLRGDRASSHVISDMWELKTQPMEIDAYLDMLEVIKPQHVHCTTTLEALQPRAAEMAHWLGYASLYCLLLAFKLRVVHALKPIFRPLSVQDLSQWRDGVLAGKPVDNKPHNIGLRTGKPYGYQPDVVGFEFRAAYHHEFHLLALYQILTESRSMPEFSVGPLPVVDSDLAVPLKRKLISHLNGNSFWTVPLQPWEQLPMCSRQDRYSIRMARDAFWRQFSALVPNLIFAGLQDAESAPAALKLNPQLIQMYHTWYKSTNLYQLTKRAIYKA